MFAKGAYNLVGDVYCAHHFCDSKMGWKLHKTVKVLLNSRPTFLLFSLFAQLKAHSKCLLHVDFPEEMGWRKQEKQE